MGMLVEADRVINVGIVKQHSPHQRVLGMKNLMGVAGGARNRFTRTCQTASPTWPASSGRNWWARCPCACWRNGPAGGNLADRETPRQPSWAGVDQVAVDAFGATLPWPPAARTSASGGRARRRSSVTMNYAALSPARRRYRWLAKRERRRWCGSAASPDPRSCCCFSTCFWKRYIPINRVGGGVKFFLPNRCAGDA